MANKEEIDWRSNSQTAKHWHCFENGNNLVVCDLDPRHCKIKPDDFGFCGVRGNVGGELHTFNYGQSVSATREVIETEAVNNFSPGATILSLGNVGCMMDCDFCQNWETSQVKYLDPSILVKYTPTQIIDICKEHGIKVISWTYNDPVVWHEFVVETSRLAQKEGLRTLYKSAFYIEEKPVDELIDCIDIFSISLKSVDPQYYRKYTGATLEPVLDRIKQVHRSGAHLEISNLIVTGLNDSIEDFERTVAWVLDNLGNNVPLHFVAFHPAYRYVNVERTSKEKLLRAREIALKAGINYCYIGNVYGEGMADTKCCHCGNSLVRRYGLLSEVIGITPDNTCNKCNKPTDVKHPFDGCQEQLVPSKFHGIRRRQYDWNKEANAVHVQLNSNVVAPVNVCVHRNGSDSPEFRVLDNDLSRVLICKMDDNESSIIIEWDQDIDLIFLPLLDRAHFPVMEDINTNLLGVVQRHDKIKQKIVAK